DQALVGLGAIVVVAGRQLGVDDHTQARERPLEPDLLQHAALVEQADPAVAGAGHPDTQLAADRDHALGPALDHVLAGDRAADREVTLAELRQVLAGHELQALALALVLAPQ